MWGAEWTQIAVEGYTHIAVYSITDKVTNEQIYLKHINSDWYCITPHIYKDDLYWQTNPNQRLDTTHIWHPAQFSTRYQSSPKENEPSTSKEEDSPDLEDDNSSVSETKTEVFPNPDTLEPTHTSPGENIAAELAQAPIFLDITEPTKEDLKGKSWKGYLPLNPSPVLRKPMASSSKTRASTPDQDNSEVPTGVPKINPSIGFSRFTQARSFAPIHCTLPTGLQSHSIPAPTTTTTTEGALKGEGPAKFDGDKDKAIDFMRDFILWWMQNENNKAFQSPFSRIALCLGKMRGLKVTDWISLILRELVDEVGKDPSLKDDEDLWKEFTKKYKWKFTSASVLEEAQHKFKQLRMNSGDIDEYIAQFEHLLSQVGWKWSDYGVLKKFEDGLQKWVVSAILNKDTWPEDINEWMEAARWEVRCAVIKQERLGGRKNFNPSLQEARWQAALGLGDGNTRENYQNRRRNDEVVPMEVNFTTTQETTPRLKKLSPENRKHLMDEGRCFCCWMKGHQSRDCSKKNQQQGQNQGTNTSTAQNTETPKTKETPPPPSTSVTDCPAYQIPSVLFRSLIPFPSVTLGRFALAYLTYLWTALAFSRDFHTILYASIPFLDVLSLSLTF